MATMEIVEIPEYLENIKSSVIREIVTSINQIDDRSIVHFANNIIDDLVSIKDDDKNYGLYLAAFVMTHKEIRKRRLIK